MLSHPIFMKTCCLSFFFLCRLQVEETGSARLSDYARDSQQGCVGAGVGPMSSEFTSHTLGVVSLFNLQKL